MTVLMAATGHVAVASFSSFSTAWSIFPLPSASTSPAHGVLSVGVAQNFIPFFFFFGFTKCLVGSQFPDQRLNPRPRQ